VNVLLWHVHGSWTTAFVQGSHRYFIPVDDERSPWGRGRARTWDWPSTTVEIDAATARTAPIDVVVLQRPEELDGLAERWLGGRRPGRDVPALYLEHNAPQGRINELTHVAADRPDLNVVHVTHFNEVFWDCGSTPTTVIEHGILDPGPRYTGELTASAVVINEARRRGRVTGTDLLDRFRAAGPLDLFGMGAAELGGIEDLPQHRLHGELARRRVYVHPYRWTSLGLSLLEAMHLGMPIVALAATEVVDAVPADAGIVSTSVDALVAATRRLLDDPAEASERGVAARCAALRRYGLARFLSDWDALLEEVTT
jgi:glycosyltransferase involved in cell wall biosynthesis